MNKLKDTQTKVPIRAQRFGEQECTPPEYFLNILIEKEITNDSKNT
nr:hypothetical protein [Clostridium acidisoli]